MRERSTDPRLQRTPEVERVQVAPPSRDLVAHLRTVFQAKSSEALLTQCEGVPHHVLSSVAQQSGREQVIEYLDSLIAQHGEVQ